MKAAQYRRIEGLMAQIEDITMERELLTHEGRQIQKALRELLVRVAAERIRAEIREQSADARLGSVQSPAT